MPSHIIKVLFCILFSLALLLFVPYIIKNSVFAQTCGGLYSMGTLGSTCEQSDGTPCTCGDDFCYSVATCTDTGLLKPCSNYNNNQTACLSCKGGGVGECCDPSFAQCAWSSAPTSIPVPTATPIPAPGQPNATAADDWCNGSTRVIDFYFNPGSGATSHQIRYGVGYYDSSTVQATGNSPIRVSGFSPNIDIYWNVWACNSSGCTQDSNGYYIKNTGPSCAGSPTNTPTPTTVVTCASPNQCQQEATSTGCLAGWSQVSGTCTSPAVCCSNVPTPTSPPGATATPPPVLGCGGVASACGTGCCAGLICTSGICIYPPSTPTPTPGVCNPGVSSGINCDVGGPASCTGGDTCNYGFAGGSQYCCPSGTNYCAGVGCTTYANCASCGGVPTSAPVATSPPLPTATPAPSAYTISGNVYIDANSNGIKDVGEANYTLGATTTLSLGSQTRVTNASGNYSYASIIAGTYSVTLSPPSGYTMTTVNPLTRTVGPSTTANFGIIANPPPTCPAGMTPSSGTTVNPGSSIGLSIGPCTNLTPTPIGIPPVEWEPPSGPPSPACSDGNDNDGDGISDNLDPGCHTDRNTTDDPLDPGGPGSNGDPTGPGGSSYDPIDDNEYNNTPTTTNPQCNDNIDNDGDGLSDNLDPGCHTDNNSTDDPGDPGNSSSTGNPSDPPGSSYNPNDDSETTPSTTCADSSLTSINISGTGSTATWTAPFCPTSPLTCAVGVNVNGPGGTINNSNTYNVPRTNTLTTLIRTVTNAGACAAGSGTAYTDSSVSINVTGGNLPDSGVTQTTTTGQSIFACLTQATYQVSMGSIPGYSVVGTSNGTKSGTVSVPVNSDTTTVFCIAPVNPWFQTDIGDVRVSNISNPVPANQYGSTDATYPGIFYSSNSNANLGSRGAVAASIKQWVINNEYQFNSDTANKNGGMSYDFYKSKIQKDGIRCVASNTSGACSITAGALNQSITESGVYEVNGSLTINNGAYTHPSGKRVVLLVSGDLTINSEIDVPNISQTPGQGNLFIAAVKGDIIISPEIGTSTFTPTTSHLDGYYTAQGDIVLDSRTTPLTSRCSATALDDLRLNVAGALVANSLKPFANSIGGGKIINNRSLCLDNLTSPSLYISSRPDFLIQLTDFYKVSYTKWKEVNP